MCKCLFAKNWSSVTDLQVIQLRNDFQTMRTWFCLLLFYTASLAAQNAEEWAVRGMKFDSLGNPSKAVECYNKALELAPNAAIIWYNRGVCYMELKKFNLAVVDFNKTLFLDTGFTTAYYNRSLAYRYTNNYQFALADISEYILRNPNEFEAVMDRAELAMEMKEYNTAILDLKTILSQFPDRDEAKFLLFQANYLLPDYATALVLIDELIVQRPGDYFLQLHRAYTLFHSNQFEASINCINLFLLNDENNTEAIRLKADNFFFMKKFTEASAIYENLLLSDSLNANLLADYGHCLLQMGQFHAADSVLTKSIRAKNEAPAYAYLGRGIARFNLNQGDLACQDWMKSSKLGEKRAEEYLKINCLKENENGER